MPLFPPLVTGTPFGSSPPSPQDRMVLALMLGGIVVILVTFILVFPPGRESETVLRAAVKAGYANPQVVARFDAQSSARDCGKDDVSSYAVSARDLSGRPVDVVVCCSDTTTCVVRK